MAKIFKIFVGIVLFVVIALILFVATLDLNQHKGRIIAAIEDATGRQFHIEGDLHLALSLTPTLVMDNATFSNASWGSKSNMVSFDKFEIEVELRPFLSGAIHVNRIILLSPTILLETNSEGIGNWILPSRKQEALNDTDEKNTKLSSILLRDILIKDAVINYNDGVTGEKHSIAIDELKETSANADSPLSLDLKLLYKQVPITLRGEFGSLNQLLANKQYPIDLAVLASNTKFSFNGSIVKPMTGKEFNFATKFNADSLDDIAQLVGSDLPELDGVNFSAVVTEKNDLYSINTLKFNAGETDLSGDITAKINGNKPSLDIKLYSNSFDITQFIAKATEGNSSAEELLEEDDKLEDAAQKSLQGESDFNIPPLPFDDIKQYLSSVDAIVDITAKEVKTHDATFSDTTITADLKSGNLIAKPSTTVVGHGSLIADVGFSSTDDDLNIALNINIDSLDKLSKLVGSPLPNIGRVKLAVELKADKTHYAINELLLNAGDSDISGELMVKIDGERPSINAILTSTLLDMDVLTNQKGAEVSVDKQQKQADKSSESVSLEQLKGTLKLFDGNVSLSAKQINTGKSALIDTNINVDLQNGDLKVEELKSNIDGGELNGKVSFNSSAEKPDFDIQLNIDSLAKLSKIVGSELPELSPVNLVGNVSFDKKNYVMNKLALKAGDTDLSGSASINLANKIPTINAKLNANLIDLTAFESKKSNRKKNEVKKEKIFTDAPLDLAALKLVNADISLKAKRIKTSGLELSQTDISASLKGGNLVIKPVQTVIAGGQLSGMVNLNAAKKSAVLSTDLTLKGLEPNKFAKLNDVLTGAKTDVDLKVIGSGVSLSQIMSGLNGKFIVKVGDGVIIDSVTGALGADVLAELMSMLNPFSESDSSTTLNCAVVNFAIEDGLAKADNGIAISMDTLNILGDGDINLKNEELDISLKAEPKEGLGLSASKFVSLVKLSGTLASPSPAADLGGTLSTGASLGTAVATGGLSLIAEGLLDRVTADLSPCDTALGIKPKLEPQVAPVIEPETTKIVTPENSEPVVLEEHN